MAQPQALFLCLTDPCTDWISVGAQGQALEALTCLDRALQGEQTNLFGDNGGRKGTSLLWVPRCHLESWHKEEQVGDLAGKEGGLCLCLPDLIWSKPSPESPAP